MIRSLSGVSLVLSLAAVAFPAQSAPSDPLALDVRDFGAKGDGVTDDTAAIQAALEAAKEHGGHRAQRHVTLPPGIYAISRPLLIPSGTTIHGSGGATVIRATTSFGGKALIEGDACHGDRDYLKDIEISDLSFEAGQSVAAFFPRCGFFTNSRILRIVLYTGYGLLLDTYTQGLVLDGLVAYGKTEQLVHLRGNWNSLSNIDKEGDTGGDGSAYIVVDRHRYGTSHGNQFRNVLIEQFTSPTKSGFVADGATELTIDGFWYEPTETSGYALEVLNGSQVDIRGTLVSVAKTPTRLKSANRSSLSVSRLWIDENNTLEKKLEVDESSLVHVDELFSRSVPESLRLPFDRRLEVERLVSSGEQHGRSVESGETLRLRGAACDNALVNPGFSAGRFGWRLVGDRPDVEEYPLSDVGTARMAHFHWAVPGVRSLLQTLKITHGQVGRPVTVSVLAASADPGLCIDIAVAGAGLDMPKREPCRPIQSGWHSITKTIVPRESGTLDVGVSISGGSGAVDLLLARAWAGLGDPEDVRCVANVASIDLGGRVIAAADASPTDGTWHVGDIVLNNRVQPSGFVGWICVGGGTPGTWAQFGAIGAISGTGRN